MNELSNSNKPQMGFWRCACDVLAPFHGIHGCKFLNNNLSFINAFNSVLFFLLYQILHENTHICADGCFGRTKE